MAIDSKAKRYAMLGFASSLISLFNVDASVDEGDRYVALTLYSGISLGAPPVVTGGGQTQRTAVAAIHRRKK